MTKLHLVTGEIGGAGKSMFAKMLIESYQSMGIDYHLVDADRTTPNVGLCYDRENYQLAAVAPKAGQKKGQVGKDLIGDNRIHFSEDLDDFSIADRLIDLAIDRDVIINLPAQVSGIVNKWIDTCDLLGNIKADLGIETIAWFVARPNSRAIELLEADYRYHQKKMQFVLVKNQLRGTGAKWENILNENVCEFLNTANIAQIELPELILAPHERDIFDREYPTFSELLESADKRLGIASKMRTRKFLIEAIENIKSTNFIKSKHPIVKVEAPLAAIIDSQPPTATTETLLDPVELELTTDSQPPNLTDEETKPSAKKARAKKSTEAPTSELAVEY
jgi:hypothetical protein